mmetsp:Transcript_1838/g.6765  ORF Transcript_1838/g.6765 Transcript_1838/m.6765 type:complete len:607 (-) Transcript_1838:104-1924(-)
MEATEPSKTVTQVERTSVSVGTQCDTPLPPPGRGIPVEEAARFTRDPSAPRQLPSMALQTAQQLSMAARPFPTPQNSEALAHLPECDEYGRLVSATLPAPEVTASVAATTTNNNNNNSNSNLETDTTSAAAATTAAAAAAVAAAAAAAPHLQPAEYAVLPPPQPAAAGSARSFSQMSAAGGGVGGGGAKLVGPPAAAAAAAAAPAREAPSEPPAKKQRVFASDRPRRAKAVAAVAAATKAVLSEPVVDDHFIADFLPPPPPSGRPPPHVLRAPSHQLSEPPAAPPPSVAATTAAAAAAGTGGPAGGPAGAAPAPTVPAATERAGAQPNFSSSPAVTATGADDDGSLQELQEEEEEEVDIEGEEAEVEEEPEMDMSLLDSLVSAAGAMEELQPKPANESVRGKTRFSEHVASITGTADPLADPTRRRSVAQARALLQRAKEVWEEGKTEPTQEELNWVDGEKHLRGVYRVRGNKWTAKFVKTHNKAHLGSFNTQKDAALVWDFVARHHGRKEVHFPKFQGETQLPPRQERMFIGVYCVGKRYMARCTWRKTLNGQKTSRSHNALGVFDTPEEAAHAYDAEARLAGRSKLNYPDPSRGEISASSRRLQ